MLTKFTVHFLDGVLNLHKKIGSLSQKLWSQVISSEWVQNIYYCQIRKKNLLNKKIKKYFFKNIFHLICSDNAFQAPKHL
jgi:hypothetical protein